MEVPVDQGVPIAPVLTLVKLGKMTNPLGQTVVLVRMDTPLGSQTYCLPPQQAEDAAKKLLELATEAKSGGIVLAQPGQVPPLPGSNGHN